MRDWMIVVAGLILVLLAVVSFTTIFKHTGCGPQALPWVRC